jgi:hypothetical protein
MQIQGNLVGGVAWHQYLAVKINNEKLAGKVKSVQINNYNIFHNSWLVQLSNWATLNVAM